MEDTELDLRGILGLLRRQFRLIVITVVVVVSVAVIAAFALTPIYSSSALILVDPSNKNLLDPQAQMSSASADSARIDSEVELVRSDNVLLRVISSEGLTADPEFGVSLGPLASVQSFLRLGTPELPTGEAALNQALAALRKAVSVQRRGLTYLISVEVRSEDPAKAARLANSVTQAYISDQLASKVNSTLASRDVLQARINQARDAIVASEDSFDNFIASNIARITADTGRVDIAQMQRQLQQLETARSESSALLSNVQTYMSSGDLDSVVSSLESDALDELTRQRDELMNNLATTAVGSPVEVDLRGQLAQIEENLRSAAATEVSALQTSLTQSQAEEDTLRQNMRREVLGSGLSTDVLTQLYELQQSAELARSQYQTLLARVQDVEAQADLQLADSRIVSPALAPQLPSFPNKTLIVALAGLAALGLGIGLAFVYENLIGGFTSEEQVGSVLRTPVAATVPRERAKSEKESLANLMVASPLSIFAESIRRARVGIEQALRHSRNPDDQPRSKVIMVTSTAPNEGKTTVALALARSYALSGQSTLLVDCDLRKPSIHRHIDLEPSRGLIDFLGASDANTVDLSGVVSHDNLTSVTIVVGSRRSDLPTDQLLAGAAFGRLIRSARETFEVVILDTPPIGPVVDGLYIAPLVDAITFVARWASTSQQDAKHAVEALSNAKQPDAPIVAILNQQDASRSSYERKYGGYYSYSSS